MKLVLATRNAHKVREFAALLAPHEVDPLPDEVELPPETGETFAENALVKARAAAQALGAPGDRRRLGHRGRGARRRARRALGALRRRGRDRRGEPRQAAAEAPAGQRARLRLRARLRRRPTGTEHLVEGRCTGTLAAEPRGGGGFGYDPAFVPDDLDGGRTMAELTPAEKDAISHRGRAARALLAWLRQPLSAEADEVRARPRCRSPRTAA